MGEGSGARGFGSGSGGGGAGPGGVLPAPTGFGNILTSDPAGTATWVPDGLPGVAAADAGKLWYWNPTTKLWTLTVAPTATGQVPVWNHTTKVLAPAFVGSPVGFTCTQTPAGVSYLGYSGFSSTALVTQDWFAVATQNILLRNLVVANGSPLGAVNNVVYTVWRTVAGVWGATTITATLSSNATGSASDLVHTATVSQGEFYIVQMNNPGAAGNYKSKALVNVVPQ